MYIDCNKLKNKLQKYKIMARGDKYEDKWSRWIDDDEPEPEEKRKTSKEMCGKDDDEDNKDKEIE